MFKTAKHFIYCAIFYLTLASYAQALEPIEVLSLDIISYEDFVNDKIETLNVLKTALLEKGIVGIKGIPGFKEKVFRFIEAAIQFSELSEDVKESYGPNQGLGEMFLGYEKGKERFKRADGSWAVDDLKASYYALVPDNTLNKWPLEINLKTPFQDVGLLMADTGTAIMEKVGLVGPKTDIAIEGLTYSGRMLHYRKSSESHFDNPFWCGSHFDHGLFTALLPAFYFLEGNAINEPLEAGLFVKTAVDGIYRKVISDDPDVLLFQVGEFGQLVTNDALRATEHRVHKAIGPVERYTLALFFNPSEDTVIHSTSELASDKRYGGIKGAPCSYGRWHEESFKRYIVTEEDSSN